MSVWSDADILRARSEGRFDAQPWHDADLTPNGLDLRAAHCLVPSTMKAPVTSGVVLVPPMTRFVLGTEQVLSMPADAVGSLWIRSSWARKGVLCSFGKVDAGFRGNLTVGAFNAGHEPFEVRLGDRFCQIVLEGLASPAAKGYAQRSGTYQDQRGVTLGPGR